MNWTEDELEDRLRSNPSLAEKNKALLGDASDGKSQPQVKEKPARYYSEKEEKACAEDWIQERFFSYLSSNTHWQPIFDLFYSIPNGSNKSKRERALFKRTGLKAGMPDVHFPVAREGYHSLYIEFKSWNGTTSPEQETKISQLKSQGHKVIVCKSVRAAIMAVKDYLLIPYDDDGHSL